MKIPEASRLLHALSRLPASPTGRQYFASVAVRALSVRALPIPSSAIKASPSTGFYPRPLRVPNPTSDGTSISSSTGAWNIIRHANGNHGAAWDPSLIPKYLHETYWWAYVHPLAIRFWDRHWLVNTILWGNYRHLRNQALMEIDSSRRDKLAAITSSPSTPSESVNNPAEDNSGLSVLHVSCVYNDFDTNLVHNHLTEPDTLHVVDVAPQQLDNVQRKLSRESSSLSSSSMQPAPHRTVHLWQQDASRLSAFPSDSMDCVVLFFLLHEVPDEVRRAALDEAMRVVRPQTGRLVIVDYDKVSSRLNPFYYIMKLVLSTLEPFALDLWRTPLRQTLEEAAAASSNISVVQHENFFGGMYQKLVVKKHSPDRP